MKIEQLYTGCLSQGAYYIESEGESAIIDPLREVQGYIDLAKERNTTIKYIFETHFHADFVSGHLTLSKKTGASIVYGPSANPDFDCIIAEDNQEFKLGKITIKILHTPGHTMESISCLVLDKTGKEYAIFSGDTLFLGDVGRPDLAQKAANMTQEELAGILFDSLRNKIMPLPDDTIVYPGHGSGSACGKHMSKETVGRIGQEKATNYALRADMTKEEFIKEVLEGLMPPPAYFPSNVMLNKKGYEDFSHVLEKSQKMLSPNTFETIAIETKAIILDVRHQKDFAEMHIPNSIFIGLDGDFAPWVGLLLKDIQQQILLVASEDKIEEAITRLARVGFDNVIGGLKGGIKAWVDSGKEKASVNTITAEDLASLMKTEQLNIYDVRRSSEYLSEHIINSKNTPLDSLDNHLSAFKSNEKGYTHCGGGYRSMIANSILKSKGFNNLIDVEGGFDAIKETDIPVSEYICPSTL